MIETTIVIDKKLKEKLKLISQETGESMTSIINNMMKKIRNEHQSCWKFGKAVGYQGKKPKDQWSRLHLTLHSRDYEYFLDMRKLFKCSVSLLVAIGIDRYLDSYAENLEASKSMTDNCPYQHYVITLEYVDNVTCWKIYWGLPESMLTPATC